MGWSGSLTESSAVGSAITFTPGITTTGGYTVDTFTAPKKGIYRFQLSGSGGNTVCAGTKGTPGKGGLTTGYKLMEAGETVHVGAGGYCSAAFVSKVTGASLAAISASNLLFVAGAGGQNGAAWDNKTGNFGGNGGDGGGATGGNAPNVGNSPGGKGGTQTAGGTGGESHEPSGAYGIGKGGGYENNNDTSQQKGRGGDGYYGGGGGAAYQANASGGGGGSGYIHTTTVKVNSKTFTNTTEQGGGAAADTVGSVVVTYYARAELPVVFNGTTLECLIFNGVEVESLIYDGVKLFFEKLRRWGRCLSLTEPVSA